MTKTSVSEKDLQIISVVWSEEKTKDFFQNIKKGTTFGYSDKFTFDQIQKKAEQYGVKVTVLPEKNSLRKKYGDYVLKVVTQYTPMTVRKVAHFAGTRTMELRTSKFKRKCSGHDCSNIVLIDVPFIEITDLKTIPNGRTVYDKKSYCSSCAKEFLSLKISELLRVMGHSENSISKHIKSINNIK
jgi:hypothetical protein